jgi:hypothetical protein
MHGDISENSSVFRLFAAINREKFLEALAHVRAVP